MRLVWQNHMKNDTPALWLGVEGLDEYSRCVVALYGVETRHGFIGWIRFHRK